MDRRKQAGHRRNWPKIYVVGCLLVHFTAALAAATLFGPGTIISDTVFYALKVYAADLDGDGDMDVLGIANTGDNVAWYENDGAGNFTAHALIDTDSPVDVHAADVDGDGDLDILTASLRDGNILWHENDGDGNFMTRVVTAAVPDYVRSIHAEDVDGDGDMDVLSASGSDGTFAWYENDGGGNFATHIIADDFGFGFTVYAADVDADGDMDVIAAGDHVLAWYENDGSEGFTIHVISTVSARADDVHAADIDGDGDMDVLCGWLGGIDEAVAWYENDGNGSFATRIISSVGSRGVYAADMDLDGDMDVLSADDQTLAWHENDGNESFATHVINNPAYSVHAADLDGDGDMDILSGAGLEHTIFWHENLSLLTVVSGNGVLIENGASTTSLGDFTDFGAADILSGSVSRTFTISNGGNVSLSISGVSVSGSEFSVTSPPAATIPVGGSADFTLAFDPASLGGKTETVTIQSNAANSPFTFAVSGVGSLNVEVTTGPVSNIAHDRADGGGSVSYSDGAAIRARGLAWSTTTRPSVALHPHTHEGAGTGDFAGQMTALAAETVYNVRAYAQVRSGGITYTFYGDVVSFSTPPAEVDSDGDGLPDDWETANGLDPDNPDDATQDGDNDGRDNFTEFQEGTDPNDPCDCLLPGDGNGDGRRDLQDALIMLQILAGGAPDASPCDCLAGADATGDGRVGIEDVIFILQKVAGSRP